MADNTNPGWKRNGRNGPLDWWLGCATHGDKWEESCISCGIAIQHNFEFKEKLELERERATASSISPPPSSQKLDGGQKG